MSLLPREGHRHQMPAHRSPTQLQEHLRRRADAGSSHVDLLLELRRYRDRLRPYEYQELLLLCRMLAARPNGYLAAGSGSGPRQAATAS